MAEQSSTRRPFTGSCHCKATRFIVYLTLPAPPPKADRSNVGPGHQSLYRCNCTLCHKAALLHIRVPSPADDFQLLSPLDPFAELGDYTCNNGTIHFFFCKTCGVRCFSFMGEAVVEEVEIEKGGDGDDGERRKIWRAKDGPVQGASRGNMYLSVNAHAIEPHQEGFDMREWTEQKKLWYLDTLYDPPAAATLERPQPGGCY